MSVLAVKAFLIAVNPVKNQPSRSGNTDQKIIHCLPVEVSFIFDTPTIRKPCKIYSL